MHSNRLSLETSNGQPNLYISKSRRGVPSIVGRWWKEIAFYFVPEKDCSPYPSPPPLSYVTRFLFYRQLYILLLYIHEIALLSSQNAISIFTFGVHSSAHCQHYFLSLRLMDLLERNMRMYSDHCIHYVQNKIDDKLACYTCLPRCVGTISKLVHLFPYESHEHRSLVSLFAH